MSQGNDQVRAHVIITGRVQGVFFRANTVRAAERCGVSGWVRNRRDGTVEAVFEGEKTAVEKILQWCRHGDPPAAVN
jgi:acylphosphatase